MKENLLCIGQNDVRVFCEFGTGAMGAWWFGVQAMAMAVLRSMDCGFEMMIMEMEREEHSLVNTYGLLRERNFGLRLEALRNCEGKTARQ